MVCQRRLLRPHLRHLAKPEGWLRWHLARTMGGNTTARRAILCAGALWREGLALAGARRVFAGGVTIGAIVMLVIPLVVYIVGHGSFPVWFPTWAEAKLCSINCSSRRSHSRCTMGSLPCQRDIKNLPVAVMTCGLALRRCI